jgi:hypothetical protein
MRKTRILEMIYFRSITKILQEHDKTQWSVRCNILSPMSAPDNLDRWVMQKTKKEFVRDYNGIFFSRKNIAY